jgi:hypothetical protein
MNFEVLKTYVSNQGPQPQQNLAELIYHSTT